jgi:hypothetical protein
MNHDLEPLIQIQASPKEATVIRYNKTSKNKYVITEVHLPESENYETMKNKVETDAYSTLGSCCQCSSKAMSFALTSFRGIQADRTTAKRYFILVEHCPSQACMLAASTISKAYANEIAQGSTIGALYQCATCKKMARSMNRCTRCQFTYYCNIECQRADFHRHKTVCLPSHSVSEERK